MPRVRNSKDLKDYSRTRQWQLRKQFININTRQNQLKHHDQSDHFIMTEDEEGLLLNAPMFGVEREKVIDILMQDVDISEELVQNGDELETKEVVDEPMLEIDPLEGTVEHEEEETEDDEEQSEADMENEENHENRSSDEQNRMWEDDEDEPLYDGAIISVAETMIAILTFALKFNLTGICLSALLQLIASIIPATPRFKKKQFTNFVNFSIIGNLP